MFFIQKKYSLHTSGILEGITDHHSHLLPGVDDGVQTLEESIETLKAFDALGIRTVWLTPHVMEDIPNPTAALKQRFEELQRHAGEQHIACTLRLAAEYMMDTLFEERLHDNDLLLHTDGQLLVETSYVLPPIHLDALLDEIKRKGHYPLLAHPERYLYMDLDDYKKYKDRHIRFQLNLPSLAGAYGTEVQKKATALLEKGYYDCCGTDTHALRAFRQAIGQKEIGKKTLERLRQLLG